MRRLAFLAACAAAAALLLAPPPSGRVLLLAPGVVEISRPIQVGSDTDVRGASAGTVVRAAAGFRGRALFESHRARRVRYSGFAIDGNRAALEVRSGLPPSNVPFAAFTPNSGILAEEVEDLRIAGVRFTQIAGFAVVVARSRDVIIERVRVTDSGSRNPAGRNNATGGVLLEEGTARFAVLNSSFENVRGNGVWTHSLYHSPRNRDGRIAGNFFRATARDAIQVGHATRVVVEGNTGSDIGFPEEEVDGENRAVPVAIDTAGDVDHSVYAHNRFHRIRGKCIDLDGFHDGAVRNNWCADVTGWFAILFNDSHPETRSANIELVDNEIDGAQFGAVFAYGSGHVIARNRFRNLNRARCARCALFTSDPNLLGAGIYLAPGILRPNPPTGMRIENNLITGFNMALYCITPAPRVKPEGNRVQGNVCLDTH